MRSKGTEVLEREIIYFLTPSFPSQTLMIKPFNPALGVKNPHAQTMFANILRSKWGVHFRRERLNTPDGDFVDLDYAYVNRHRWLWTELGQAQRRSF